MKKFLIIEDDSFKREDLSSFVAAHVNRAIITHASDVASAVHEVQDSEYDLIIIDMALPSHPVIPGGGSPMSLLTGGLEILFELSTLERNDDCVIVTQYPEIEIAERFVAVKAAAAEIKKQFGCDVLACLEYSEYSTDWKIGLANILKKYENSSSGR